MARSCGTYRQITRKSSARTPGLERRVAAAEQGRLGGAPDAPPTPLTPPWGDIQRRAYIHHTPNGVEYVILPPRPINRVIQVTTVTVPSSYTTETTERGEACNRVSGRFLTDFFRVLERHGVPASRLLGDLPVPRGETDAITGLVEWSIFADFMKRLEREVGGPEGVEACGGLIAEFAPAAVLRGLVGFTASPVVLYRGAIRWALQRAIPGIQTRISPPQGNQLMIHAALAAPLQPCPQIFHFATGGARALPRLLGMADAVVSAEIGDREATYRIILPPSLTIFARVRRLLGSVFSAGAVVELLERQQLELHAQYDALERTHAALAASEQLHRARTDAAADVVCEIDARGRIVYASASVQDLIGYRPEQVIGSHYRLWIPKDLHALADARFEAIASQRLDGSTCQELVELHADHGQRIRAEISIRSYQTPDGDWRLVGVLRARGARGEAKPASSSRTTSVPLTRDHERRRIDELRDRLTHFDPSSGTPEGVDPSRGARTPHPLHHSLEVLIAALERVDPDRDSAHADSLTAATRAMARIADAALARAEDPNAHVDWIETRKLLDLICDRVTERTGDCFEAADERGLELIPEDPVGVPEIWGRVDLLENAIGSLTDHGVSLASLDHHRDPISIGVRTWRPRDDRSGVEFVLEVPANTTLREPSSVPTGLDGPRPAVDASEHCALSLAIARDAASLLGGELLIDDLGTGTGEAGGGRRGHRLRLRIPQPARTHGPSSPARASRSSDSPKESDAPLAATTGPQVGRWQVHP